MEGQHLDVIRYVVGVKGLHRFSHRPMKIGPPIAKQAAVDRLLRQDVTEGVDLVARLDTLNQQPEIG